MVFISKFAIVDDSAEVDDTASIWHFSQIREKARIGKETIIGKSVYIGTAVWIGDRCKIQNNSQIYEPSVIHDEVFVGPGVVFTNDKIPRSTNLTGEIKSSSDWNCVGVVVETGASIGANSTCVAPLRIGKWSMIGAGSVVTKDVPQYALVAGVPARQIAWINETGERLIQLDNDEYRCPITNRIFRLSGKVLEPIED